jgi:capsular polysaccharide biosynthesis protein
LQEEKEISIQELFLFFWKRKFFIILAAIVFALMSFLITRFLITPIYQSSVQFYVNNYEQGKEDSTRVLSSDLSAAQALVNTYIAIIQSDSVLQQVMGIAKQSIELNYTTDQMRKMISAEPINGTEIFKISVQNKDPKAALVIASALA